MSPGRMRTSYPDKERWGKVGGKEGEGRFGGKEQGTEPKDEMEKAAHLQSCEEPGAAGAAWVCSW